MTNQPKFYVGIDTCGCIVGFIANLPGYEDATAGYVAQFIECGLVVEGRNEDSAWGHTCGKDGAK